ncbi:PKD domain-containing protein [Muriicola jejuensis]|uniref:PKD domain-containing protein n=1 Tax=Muriicola jejuensis TaxID=504488 RepID=A0A6P0UFI6_9FLAO|nr:PKD domain-containing protein [Muriicola jejuensis]NER10649.1 PKD domain-containing protein [Muriicola jejuensis]
MKKAKAIAVFFMAIAYLGCEDVTNLFPDVISAFTYTIDADTGTVTFINISEEADSYLWTFGDGDSSTEINPVKSYAASGTYTVTLKATNVAGASDSSEDAITINLPLVLEQVTLPITFDDPDVDYTPETFSGTSFSVVENPDVSGSNDKAGKVGAITNSGAAFEGIFFDLGTDIDLTTDKSITMNFWADAPVDILMKLEEGSAAAIETVVSHGGTGWETTTFDFTSSAQYSRLTLFVDGPGTTAGTFYIDDIKQVETSTGGGPIAPTAGPAAPTQDAADVISIFSDTYTDVPNEGFNNYGSAAFEQADLGGNAALRYTFAAGGGGNFQVIELGGANQIDAAAAGMTNFRFDIWFPNEVDPSSAFLMKVVDIPGSGATEALININDSSTPAIEQGTWLSFDIPITELQANGLGGYSNIQQLVIDLVTSGEVYIDNIYFYKPASGGGGGPIAPTAGPTAPTQDPADVISIFSDTYTDVPNSGFNNYGSAAFEQADLGGNAALRYTFAAGGGGNFQVIELGGANQIDAAAAGMTNFRFDIWFPNEVDTSSAFLMKVVDIPGSGATEALININDSSTPAIEQGTWLSFDLPITELQANGLGGYSNIQQVVIDLVTSGEVYIDNIYFYKPPGGGGGGTAPTTSAPVPPTRDAADVISIYGESYTNISGINYDPNWGQSGHTLVNPAYDPGDGNLALAYPNFNYQGTDFAANAQDASAMEFLHVDIWVPTGTDRQVKVSPINSGTGAGEVLVQVPLTPGSWNSVDLPIASFTGMTWDQVVQLKFDGQFNGDGSANGTPYDIYLDNIYFYKEPTTGGGTAPTTSAPTPPARDAADVISIYGESYTNISGINYDPNWGQSGHTLVNPAYDPGDGDLALAYPNFNYQGTDFAANAQDASTMEFLHVDIWVPTGTDRQVKVSPINSGTGAGEVLVQVPLTPGSWNSVDLPIASFTGMTWDQVVQLKFDGQFNGDGSANGTPYDIYLDNIYFYKSSGGGGTPGELTTNGDFETGDTTGWLFFDNGGATAITSAESNGGAFSAQITSGQFNNPGIKQERFGVGTVLPNQVIDVVLDSKVQSLVDGAIVNVLAFSESSTPGAPAVLHNLGTINVTPGAWNTNTFSFTTASDVTGGISLLIEVVCGGATTCNGVVYFDNVSVKIAP